MHLEGVQGENRDYVGTSLNCLKPDNWLRLIVITIIEWPWFERFSLTVVMFNCVLMAIQGPPSREVHPLMDLADQVCTAIFSVELVLKVVAMGFWGKGAYIADSWNQLDFVVVATSWLPLLFPTLNDFSSMRAIRALRPLRTINRLPELRRQVVTLIESLPQLLDVAMLAGFILVVLGVLGVQLFSGLLHNRCYDEGASTPFDVHGDSPYGVCAAAEADTRGSCMAGQTCRDYGQNPLEGTVGFDSIGAAWMTIFQCLTLEGWTEVLYMTQRVAGSLATIYCLTVVVLGAFYVLNLFLAVMWHVNNRPLPIVVKRGKKAPKVAVETVEEVQTEDGIKRVAMVRFKLGTAVDGPSSEPTSKRSDPALSTRADSACERFVNNPAFQSTSVLL